MKALTANPLLPWVRDENGNYRAAGFVIEPCYMTTESSRPNKFCLSHLGRGFTGCYRTLYEAKAAADRLLTEVK